MLRDEPPLASYLRELARQTQLTVLAYWPQNDKEPLSRMPRSIVNKPVAEALDTLCEAYHCNWVQDGALVRLRAQRKTDPASQAPEAGAAPSGLHPSPAEAAPSGST